MATTPRPRRGPYAKTRGRVEAVGEIAYDVVVQQGHRALTMAEVARRSGLTDAQLLYHFPSRDHLLVAALEHADGLSRQQRTRGPAADPEAAFARAVNDRLAAPPVIRLFVTVSAEGTDPEHPAHAWLLARQREIVVQYAGFLRELQAQGWAHRDVDPERFARELMALWDGLQAQWLLDPSLDLGAEVAAGLRALARRDAVLAREALDAAFARG